jgi:hypothetical protein
VHAAFKPLKAIADSWQLVQATLTGVRSPREFIVERFSEGYIIQGIQGGDGDFDVSVAYPVAQPPNWSPIAEFDEYLRVAFAKLARQDTLTRAQMKDIFVKLAIEKHLAPLWFSFFSLAFESSRPCQKMTDMVGNFGATMPQGPGMDKLQALCRTIPPSDDDE